ncbi:MAG: hypothetical protein Q9160_002033 [Pyrenula sp. 1 TL-2023]
MPALLEPDGESTLNDIRGYSVTHQKLTLDLDFQKRSVKGESVINVQPNAKDLRTLRFNLRQCKVSDVVVNNVPVPPSKWRYSDPYENYKLHTKASVHQHHIIWHKIESSLDVPPDEELVIQLPDNVVIEESDPFNPQTFDQTASRQPNGAAEADLTTTSAQVLNDSSVSRFKALIVEIRFQLESVRDGFHYLGPHSSTKHLPCFYSLASLRPGTASAAFPCIDSINSRCTWDIVVKCPTTLANAVKPYDATADLRKLNLGDYGTQIAGLARDDRDLTVVCSGDLTDEIVDRADASRKTVSYSCTNYLSAQQIGIVVGPFERVNFAEFRDNQQEDEAAQSTVELSGYCLPGQTLDLRNTCLPIPRALDHITRKYASYPFRSYSICFVEDLADDVVTFASFSLCSSRMLFPDEIIDPADDVTRKLVHALASQWIGINIVPKEPTDTWVIVGIAHFITDAFMRELSGMNEYRFRLKQNADRVCELDHARPSLHRMGSLLHVDRSELEFMELKAPLVLFILERRITKTTGMPRMPSIIGRIFLRATTGEIVNGELSTEYFQRMVEKFYHSKIDDFLSQWVRGAGCPSFRATQRFNKKKLVVEMLIQQMQGDQHVDRDLNPNTFLRDVKEDFQHVYAAPVQNVFTGPMTIRIHEADGTPYEHIVEIKESLTKFEIPYNTKYKRLKRSKRQRERAAVAAGLEAAETQDDVLLYSLGDVLQTEEEVREWKLQDWSPEQEEEMNQESYEWIRLDVDFEWISSLHFAMPGYMFVSQLQQDRDVVAQLESIQHMDTYAAHPLLSSIMVRTLMDRRYFHGIRSAAAKSLIKHARQEIGFVGLFHLKKAFEQMFCLPPPNTRMTKPNDFTNRASYYVQCTIIRAISQIRNHDGEAPMDVKEFLLDKLKFNDNSTSEYSDCHYVATIIRALTDALVAKHKSPLKDDFAMDIDHHDEVEFEEGCVAHIDRFRRMDEWTSSYQNLYARVALESQRRLSQANVHHFEAAHFLQYTRSGNYDLLRVSAFESLLALGIFKSRDLLRWYLYGTSRDTSSWVRESLRASFCKALARLSIGTDAKAELTATGDTLVIEQEISTEAIRADVARRKTIAGAAEALRKDLSQDSCLAESLWEAMSSPCLRLHELHDFLDICKLLFEERYESMVALRYPRYWKMENLGKGVLRFTETGVVRTKPRFSTKPAKLPPLQNGNSLSEGEESATIAVANGHPSQASPVALQISQTPQPAKPKLKLKLTNSHSAGFG